jgi:hypothetical protein
MTEGTSMKKKLALFVSCMISLVAKAETITPFTGAKISDGPGGVMYADIENMGFSEEIRREITTSNQEMKTKGYVEKVDEFVPILMTVKRDSAKILRESAKTNDPLDTNLKAKLSDIKLSFSFHGESAIASKDIIGFAANGSYKKGAGVQEGWTGIGMYFAAAGIGNCVYSYNHIPGKAIMFKGDTEYKINKNPGDYIVKGTQHTGFLYSINWYTENTASSMECANMKLDKNIHEKMVALASRIDAAQNKIH